MKKAYNGVVLLAVLAAAVLLTIGSSLLSGSSVHADSVVPISRAHAVQGIHAPVFPEEAEHRFHMHEVRKYTRSFRLDSIEERITNREQEIARLEMEIQFLEQRMLQILGQEINQLQEKIEFLSRHQTDKGVGDLSLGDRDPRVRSLQVFLNQNGFPLAAAGPGSDGKETDYFGPLTLRSLRLFQGAQGIPVTGMVDAATRTALDTVTLDDDTVSEESDEETASTEEKEESKQTLVSFLKNIFRSIFGGSAVSEE